MREIKFRAWDKETKELSYDFLNKNWLKVCIESPYVELMQYTGLTDRNGKEIYEGCIFQIGKSVGVIVYEKDGFEIDWKHNPEFWNEHLRHHVTNGEVIGTIYENPELLEVSA